MEEANAKQRWGRKKEDEMKDMDEMERKEAEEEDVRNRQMYDMEGNVLDYGRM